MASEYEPVTMGSYRGWIHQCGNVDWWPVGQAPADGGCDGCESGSDDASDWRPLYVDGAHNPDYGLVTCPVNGGRCGLCARGGRCLHGGEPGIPLAALNEGRGDDAGS